MQKAKKNRDDSYGKGLERKVFAGLKDALEATLRL